MDARRGYAVGLAVLALTVSACTANGEEQAKTSSTAPSSSSTSSSTTAPSSAPTSGTATVDPANLPPEARKHTPEGAAAFVKYYVEATNQASRTADVSLLPPLADAGCRSCAAIQSSVEQLQKQQRHYSADPVNGISADPLPGGAAGQQLVRLQMMQSGAKVVDSSGKVVDEDKRMNVARTVSVVWRGDSWIVYGIA